MGLHDSSATTTMVAEISEEDTLDDNSELVVEEVLEERTDNTNPQDYIQEP
jgi:hypothetical protein